jgi:CHASE3 domain sensor protein
MVNAETGMRGYLLTRNQAFLEPYALAEQGLPGTLTDITTLTE